MKLSTNKLKRVGDKTNTTGKESGVTVDLNKVGTKLRGKQVKAIKKEAKLLTTKEMIDKVNTTAAKTTPEKGMTPRGGVVC